MFLIVVITRIYVFCVLLYATNYFSELSLLRSWLAVVSHIEYRNRTCTVTCSRQSNCIRPFVFRLIGFGNGYIVIITINVKCLEKLE